MSEVDKEALWRIGLTPAYGHFQGELSHRAKQNVLKTVKQPCKRLIVNILGEPRQGKTSLKRLLTREPFDPNEESTVAIEQELVETCTVDSKWKILSQIHSSATDYKDRLNEQIYLHLKNSELPGKRSIIQCYCKVGCVLLLALIFYSIVQIDSLRPLPVLPAGIVVTCLVAWRLLGVRDGPILAVTITATGSFLDVLILHQTNVNSTEETKSLFCWGLCIGMHIVFGVLTPTLLKSFGAVVVTGLTTVILMATPGKVSTSHILRMVLGIVFVNIGMAVSKMMSTRLKLIAASITLLFRILMMGDVSLCCIFFMYGVCWVSIIKADRIGKITVVKVFCELGIPNPYRRWAMYVFGMLLGPPFSRFFGWSFASTGPYHIIISLGLLALIELTHVYTDYYATINDVISTAELNKTWLKLADTSSEELPNEDITLVIRDFAGHKLYHSTHHVFMTEHAVYVIVFKLPDAFAAPEEMMKSLTYWINSVLFHTNHNDPCIILVGTHRNDQSLSPSKIKTIENYIDDHLPSDYLKLLMWNPRDTLVFCVENSSRVDCHDYSYLLKTIRRCGTEREFQRKQLPLRFFAFGSVLEKMRKQNSGCPSRKQDFIDMWWLTRKLSKREAVYVSSEQITNHNSSQTFVIDYDILYEICKETDCQIKSKEQFTKLLKVFHDMGEIIYKDIPGLGDIVVTDPQILIDIVAAVVTQPKKSEIKPGLVAAYKTLHTKGIASQSLLNHIIKEKYPQMTSDTLAKFASLFDDYDLMCSMKVQNGNNASHYIIPQLLPEIVPDHSEWKSKCTTNDHVYFIGFNHFHPQSMFVRLLCASLRHQIEYQPSFNILDAPVYRFNAWCTYKSGHAYHLSLDPDTRSTLIKVIIRCEDSESPVKVLGFLNNKLQAITKRDFNKVTYTIGPLCPVCTDPEHAIDEKVHIIPMMGTSIGYHKRITVWCSGQKVQLQHGKVLPSGYLGCGSLKESPTLSINAKLVNNSAKATPNQKQEDVKLTDETPIYDLPHELYVKIRQLLSLPSVLGNDYTGLAGILGKTLTEVMLYQLENNPCDALLKDWAKQEDATLGNLIKHLKTLQQFRIISTIEEFCERNVEKSSSGSKNRV
ncbi:unnamed protein product [Owenia fusiformis]|uniref:Uncharacterized protein n=1 Tax=Owenia fusiformis TaxID=6347 RepID=A0A8J1U0Z0_OWEFU|nr:unnamed protein product [Owenia fusiformis]